METGLYIYVCMKWCYDIYVLSKAQLDDGILIWQRQTCSLLNFSLDGWGKKCAHHARKEKKPAYGSKVPNGSKVNQNWAKEEEFFFIIAFRLNVKSYNIIVKMTAYVLYILYLYKYKKEDIMAYANKC